MAHVVTPQHHLLRKAASGVVEGDRKLYGNQKHTPKLDLCKFYASRNTKLM